MQFETPQVADADCNGMGTGRAAEEVKTEFMMADSQDHSLSADSADSRQDLVPSPFKTYKRRWYILSTMAVLNISNAMSWICFAAVTNFTAEYFEVSIDAVSFFSLVFLIVSIPGGFLAAWELDTYGLRLAIVGGAWLNFFGNLLRYLSTVFGIPPTSQYAVAMVGQTMCALSQPFLLFSPTKMAALWFPDNQRATANMLASMANPLGILISFALSAGLVSSASDIPLMLGVFAAPAAIGVAMATLGVCSSAPPTPPSPSADSKHEPFSEGFKKCMKNRPFWILIFSFGAGYGIFSAVSTFVEVIVCPIGFNDNFAGLVGALMLGAGLLGAIIMGLIVDRTRAFTPVVKLCYVGAMLFLVVFSISSQFESAGVGLLIGGTGLGLFGLAQFAISLELGVECTYPVAEGTSACLLQVSGQFQGMILILIAQFGARAIPVTNVPDQECINLAVLNSTALPDNITATVATASGLLSTMFSSTAMPETVIPTVQDLTIPLFVYAGYGVLVTLVLLFFFRTKYHRLEEENAARSAANGNVPSVVT
ncbi:solute carrier family 49 member A3-like [Diadema antillarum]|uniref:solute carrier family 49 member A3-like n=1 Tax=Diadema antillarum TaxID=105358 RepID=UPI003A8C5D72